MKLSTYRQYEHDMACFGGPWTWHHGASIVADDIISFTTKGGTRVQGGMVLEVDLLASFPIRVEYHGPEGKRIERFHPDEFKTFNKENRQ